MQLAHGMGGVHLNFWCELTTARDWLPGNADAGRAVSRCVIRCLQDLAHARDLSCETGVLAHVCVQENRHGRSIGGGLFRREPRALQAKLRISLLLRQLPQG